MWTHVLPPDWPMLYHDTDIISNTYSIVFPGWEILEELIFRIALAAGPILSSIRPAELGKYWIIYTQMRWVYIIQLSKQN